ncbi:acyl-CoA dehydrogenase family protein [Sphingomonas sp. MMS24-JH45]
MDEHVYPARTSGTHSSSTRRTCGRNGRARRAEGEGAHAAGLLKPVPAARIRRLLARPHQSRIRAARRDHGSRAVVERGVQLPAPDTGNMEVLAKFGSPEQQAQWLKPLLAGTMRSAYVMTEPQVASSDATNLEMSIVADGDDYVLNGRKWWISNFMHPACDLLIVMGKTDFDAPRHAQHLTIIVPRSTPGITVVKHQRVFGSLNSPGWAKCELRFEDVRVPRENLILGEGRGFEIAQGRLGPAHPPLHALDGQAQRALEIVGMRRRVQNSRRLRQEAVGLSLRSGRTSPRASARSRWRGC